MPPASTFLQLNWGKSHSPGGFGTGWLRPAGALEKGRLSSPATHSQHNHPVRMLCACLLLRHEARCCSARPTKLSLRWPGTRLVPFPSTAPQEVRAASRSALSEQHLHRAACDLNRKRRSVRSGRSRLLMLLRSGAPRSAAASGLAPVSGSGGPQGFASHEVTAPAPVAPPLPARRDLCPPDTSPPLPHAIPGTISTHFLFFLSPPLP